MCNGVHSHQQASSALFQRHTMRTTRKGVHLHVTCQFDIVSAKNVITTANGVIRMQQASSTSFQLQTLQTRHKRVDWHVTNLFHMVTTCNGIYSCAIS